MDSKATVEIEGNEELQEGENEIVITVTAEDKSTSKYTIKIIRTRQPLVLTNLVIKYTNQEGELIELPLNPVFDINTLEYSLEDIEYWVDKLLVEAAANLPDATIEVQGADNLEVGENTIIVTLTIRETAENLEEGQEPKEEKIVCKIKVNKLAEPTFWEKVKNKVRLIFGGISNWYNGNQEKIVVYSLSACVAALIILSAYIVVDYKKYKTLIEKLRKLEGTNLEEIVEETATEGVVKNQILKGSEEIEEKPEIPTKPKRGKHF